MPLLDRSVAATSFALFLTASVGAQCTPQWISTGSTPGVRSFINGPGRVRVVLPFDPDGAGPAAPVTIVAGSFASAGPLTTNGIAACDPATSVWSPLGTGIQLLGEVQALTVGSNGQLFAGGFFATAGGVPAVSIAEWDGASWSAVGGGMNASSTVSSLVTMPNGDIVAAGDFTTAGGVPVNGIARWDGASWAPLGTGTDGYVASMALTSSGQLVVAGAFTTAGGVPANNIASWDGTSWSAIGAGANDFIASVVVQPNGDIVIGGSFTQAGGSPAFSVARWDGTSWSPLGSGVNSNVAAVAADPNGDVLVGGSFSTAGGAPAACIARWNGLSWSALGAGVSNTPSSPMVRAIHVSAGGIVTAGGDFTVAGGVGAYSVARWDGAVWSAFGVGGALDATVRCSLALANGDLLVGGGFLSAGGVPAARIARRQGTTWVPLGTGIQGLVDAVAQLPNGDVVAGGVFTSAGGAPASHIARWNGIAWSPVGSGINANVHALCTLANGDLIAGGYFTSAGGVPANSVARWNGSSWTALGSGVNSNVLTLAELPNGDIVAGGVFTVAGGAPVDFIARWDGTTWSPLGGGVAGAVVPILGTSVNELTVSPQGDLIVAGNFTSAGGVFANSIARWDGASWSALGAGIPGVVGGLAWLPNGDLIAAGSAPGGATGGDVWRWNGSWTDLGAVLNAEAHTVSFLDSGEIFVGGSFTTINGQLSSFSTRLVATCPAFAGSTGAGCVGSGGLATLASLGAPWVDSTFRTRGSALPATAIVLAVTSTVSVPQGIAPLSLFFPQAGPGCDLLVAPDILQAGVTLTGTIDFSLFLPNTPPLVGVSFHQQLVPIELDGVGAWTAVLATNRLTATVGSF